MAGLPSSFANLRKSGTGRRGHASALVRRAIELSGPLVVLSAQAYLVDWYASFGFEEHGERWIEDGIEHVPMRLEVRR